MGVLAWGTKKLKDVVKNASVDEAVLSDSQINEIDRKRNDYLRQMNSESPDATSKGNKPELSVVEKNMGAVGIEIYQDYLGKLKTIYSPLENYYRNLDADNRIRYFDIAKWVTSTEEKNIDKLVNVYHVLNGDNCNIALIYNRTKEKCGISIATINTDSDNSDPAIVDEYYSRITGAIRGNFPGAELAGINGDHGIGTPESLTDITGVTENTVKSVAIVSNVASEKSEDFLSQGIEKLLDGIVPDNKGEDYTIILLARPVQDLLVKKNRLYEIYSALAPNSSWNTGYTISESSSQNSTINTSMNVGAGAWLYASANFGLSFASASSANAQIGKAESIQKTNVNYAIKHTLDIIDDQIKRIEESSALGLWDFAAYIISDSPVIVKNVAHMYLALTQGEKSNISNEVVNFWDGDTETKQARAILGSLQKLQHPVFGLRPSLKGDWLMYPSVVTPTTSVSGKELAWALNFPQKSVCGIPVCEVAPFGREPNTLLDDIELDLDIGSAYHMRKEIPEQRVLISKEELTKHAFITGSTGSGKSNTVYKLLESLGKENIKFLVVEPAKGEYKGVIGKKKGVTTYITNPLLVDNDKNIELLALNPFRFPKHTHVLEHLDRLVEIFNVCWPMYAAMPAILKDSIERAYKRSGWDLINSTNSCGAELFPTFNDVVIEIKQVLDESDYSADNKGDYTGSLVTRLKSLTNGLNGLLFTCNDISDASLFDRDVIIDLSRVGSMETKALIMGLLVLKLQEYRMEQRSNGHNLNDELKHVTVLEEAHNLLKKTSTEQVTEGANLLGKSVEMLSNSIAEMRTYGEGFIIADQAPGLLDMSIIRNTNTKIILKLPDYSDRELVGKSAGLSEKQIDEVQNLEKGVAVISQSDWLEPILCKVDKYDGEGEPFLTSLSPLTDSVEGTIRTENKNNNDFLKSLTDNIINHDLYRKVEHIDIEELRSTIIRSRLDTIVKRDLLEYIGTYGKEAVNLFRTLTYDYFNAETAIKEAGKNKNIEDWVNSVIENLNPPIDKKKYDIEKIALLMSEIVNEQFRRNAEYKDILESFDEMYRPLVEKMR